jgi:Protein of unknown function (DUF4230)
MAKDTEPQYDTRPLPRTDRATPARRSGDVLGRFLGRMITRVLVVAVVVLVIAYAVIAKIESLNPFASHTTITTTVVLGKLTKIDQVHVATRSYPADVKITQSVGIIPCFLICNQMELRGSGSDDAIVDLSKLSKRDVSIDQATKTVTVRLAAPTIGPASLNPADCTITSTHGAINSLTQGFRNNPNGYRPLYTAAENQIHDTAQDDQTLLGAGEQGARTMLAQLLGDVGVKKVTVEFIEAPSDL